MSEPFANHAMLDLETMSNASSAAIVSMAALRFDPRGDRMETLIADCLHPTQFYRRVRLSSSVEIGLTIDADTVMWWLKQDKSAQAELTEGCTIHVAHALDQLGAWCFDNQIGYVWSHGAGFDVVILANAYNRLGRQTPWKYNHVRDTRTVYDLAGIVLHEEPSPEGYLQHHALWDCWKQAAAVQKAYRRLGLSE